MVDAPVRCGPELRILAVPGLPRIGPGDDLATLIGDAIDRSGIRPQSHDVLVVTSKVVSRAEDRFENLAAVTPSERAIELAANVDKDPRLVELILRESTELSRQAPGVLIVRHRLGFVSANAAIDTSNAAPAPGLRDVGPWVLLMPLDPDASAKQLRRSLEARFSVSLGVILSDSHGRPFRQGTVGMAVGSSGLPPLADQRGTADLDGRELEHTETALADQIAAAADLVAGQAGEGRAVVLVRGLSFLASEEGAASLLRPRERDLYA